MLKIKIRNYYGAKLGFPPDKAIDKAIWPIPQLLRRVQNPFSRFFWDKLILPIC
jgi:hypothetical protein